MQFVAMSGRVCCWSDTAIDLAQGWLGWVSARCRGLSLALVFCLLPVAGAAAALGVGRAKANFDLLWMSVVCFCCCIHSLCCMPKAAVQPGL